MGCEMAVEALRELNDAEEGADLGGWGKGQPREGWSILSNAPASQGSPAPPALPPWPRRCLSINHANLRT